MASEELSDEEVRACWRQRWLSAIQAFADNQTQQSRWLDPNETNPHYSFVECMCCYFDDARMSEPDALKQRVEKGDINPRESAVASQFHALAEAYKSPNGDDWDAATILADPAWHAVCAAARATQEALLEVLSDPDERQLLSTPLIWSGEGGSYRADAIGSTVVRLAN